MNLEVSKLTLWFTEKSMENSRKKFDNYITGFRMLVTRVPQYALPFWYGKTPMFWLPYGWFPYWTEWLLSFPRAPLGSVSIVSWQLACTGTIALLSEVIGSIFGLLSAAKESQGKRVNVPAQTEEKTDGTSKGSESKEQGKKEI